MFNSLNDFSEGRQRRGLSLMGGFFAEALVIAAAALVSILFPKGLPVASRYYALVWLPELAPPAKPVAKPKPQPPKVNVFVPLERIKPTQLIAPPMADVVVPKVHPIPPAPVVASALPAPPVARPTPPKEQIVVRTGLFGGGAPHVTTKRPIEEVQTGGFGNPEGLPGRAEGGNPGNVPKLGSFDLPEGPGVGNGTGGTHGIPGVVASAGFGSGIAGAASGRRDGEPRVTTGGFGKTGTAQVAQTGQPQVATGGFEKAAPVAPAAVEKHAPTPEAFQPVEILFKPSPVYTEDARRLKIQGEVALSVVFQASGAMRVISVVKSLGHGLDEAAEQAATQIRFKPAQRAGQPADFPATLRIQFRLADQST
jgi:TonB family protein